jgi:hypothetical protein
MSDQNIHKYIYTPIKTMFLKERENMPMENVRIKNIHSTTIIMANSLIQPIIIITVWDGAGKCNAQRVSYLSHINVTEETIAMDILCTGGELDQGCIL